MAGIGDPVPNRSRLYFFCFPAHLSNQGWKDRIRMLGALLAVAASSTGCNPVPGFSEIEAISTARWIVVGETHGTTEIPAMFADLVCLASNTAPVTVAVEQPEADQAAIDAYLRSDGGDAAQTAFLRASMWRAGQPDSVLDGRSSEAMFKLFQTLWAQHKQGRVTRVIAFEPGLSYKDGAFRMPWLNDKPMVQDAYEQRMAALLQTAATDGRKMLVLTGSFHARLTPFDQMPDLRPMASFLPKDETVALVVASHGRGNAWNCNDAGCGVHPVEQYSGPTRSIMIDNLPDQSFSGTVLLGVPVTASMPKQVSSQSR